MGFLLSLSLILLLNPAGRFECLGVDDGAVPTPLLSTSTMEEVGSSDRSTKATIEKREVTSGEFSSPDDVEARKILAPPAVDASTAYPIDDEGDGRKPLIIDLGNLSSIRVRRSDSSEFTDSAMAEQGEPAEEDEDDGSSTNTDDPAIQESAEDPTNIREERQLESDEILEGVEQDHGKLFGDWYHRRTFAERRLQN